ncbi:MAG TPA: hypothetical protein PLL20_12190 [Phycisphaerae bacterium]|nr:hypothetical protein [Phycisphaerae bacterium]HRR84797.1 hypothetical protein [Phycisphaerae bacterium]
MKKTVVVTLGLAICLGSGCACRETARVAPVCQPAVRPAPSRTELAAGLLFDRRPGLYDASEFTIRGDWPSTVSFWSPGQVIYAREHLIDVQGPRWGGHSYQRFHTERVMVGHR